MSRNYGGIFDFNHDGEVSASEQAFGLGAILNALSETDAEVKITSALVKMKTMKAWIEMSLKLC